MTKLNKAFIRAYGKDVTSSPRNDRSAESELAVPSAEVPSGYADVPVEEMYADGTWYRVDCPSTNGRGEELPVAAISAERAEPTAAKLRGAASRPAASSRVAPSAEPMFPAQALTWDASTFVIMPGLVDFSPGAPLDGEPLNEERPVEAALSPNRREGRGGEGVVDKKSTHAKVADDGVRPVTTKVLAEAATRVPVDSPTPAVPVETEWDPPAAPAKATPLPESALADDQHVSAHSLVPAWEVTQLLWPGICERLESSDPDYVPRIAAELQSYLAHGVRTIAVTSTRSGEGCTTFALCLARRAAVAGVRVALLDAHLESPELASSLGVEAETGWNRAIAERLPLGEAAIRSVDDQLTLFPATPCDRLPPLSLQDSAVEATLRRMMAEFELVVVDLGPLHPGVSRWFRGDGPSPSLMGGAIVVRNLRTTSEDQTLITAARLRSFGAERIGIIENFASRTG